MQRMVCGVSLLIVGITAGCANSQMHQSLILHENRRLEDALYVAHAQVADLKRENESLRIQQVNDIPGSPRRSSRTGDDGFDFAPPIEIPTVILPDDSGTTDVPDFLKGSQVIPIWMPRR